MSLPTGFAVRLHEDVEVADAGRLLVGGSPLRAVRLGARARQAFGSGGDLVVADPVTATLADRLLEANLALPVLHPDHRAAAEELTVVIPIRDRADQLDRALAGLAGLRVLVVDDASHDPQSLGEVARAHGAEVLHLDHNVGPAAARNIGLARVRTPYVAFVDSDVQVAAETLLGLTAHFADPRVALVAPHVRARAVSSRPGWVERYEEAVPGLGLGERGCLVRPGAVVAWVPSACLVARADRLGTDGAGGFDHRLRLGEDVDLVWRLVAAGERVRYDPSYVALHDARPTVRAWAGRRFAYGTSGAVLAARHPDNVVTAVLSPVLGIAGLALLARRWWSVPVALVAASRGAQVLVRTLPDVPERPHLAARLSLRGLGWSLRQEAALVLRHWWPAAFAAGLVSRRARRVIVSAVLVDVAVEVATTRFGPARPTAGTAASDAAGQAAVRTTVHTTVGPVTTFAGRRLDDLAYGAGLWWGALRQRSWACLKVGVPGARRRG